MLLHIYKNLFIQMLRRAGYSKKQAKTIYARFIVELKRESFVECSIHHGRISGGIIWDDTKQGHHYWDEVHHNLYKKGL